MLYIVATPIGNLKDITFRAIEILKSVDIIACEDTRHTKILLLHYNIQKPLISYHSYNRVKQTEYILSLLKQEKAVALVSEAGTPSVSDPGACLVKQVIENNLPFNVIPGPTALIAGLVLSGFDTSSFVFEGFLPIKPGARKRALIELKNINKTIVLYEAPHRIIRLLEEILDVFGDTNIACARELTKKFEEVKRERTAGLLSWFKKERPRGEFVIVIPAQKTR